MQPGVKKLDGTRKRSQENSKVDAKRGADIDTGTDVKGEKAANRSADMKYKSLVEPSRQQSRKEQFLKAFERLQTMSMEELQVEFIVCLRAKHYKDALMYSEIILNQDPNNPIIRQFQPLLASISVQENERLVDSTDSDDTGEEGDGRDEALEGEEQEVEGGEGEGEEGASNSDSDDPETNWMWSPTWRTDADELNQRA
ncbi:hypothetical protein GUITHDRAFT_101070 [Guillardia theta CCMP2712]|uniref:Uncharacterized protein n=1 Tax=Guillardia theta (strain CCMP2712) TaxID=905079 RepID=L1JXS7_GUITC|nr:hypothetical protein GUITHDRAFT_101070 [Guillardia theta CCMP2712]EKX53366.1 hypothetical protein GUITHDRAFT_101070 [Guillardia theta CCMP2712]|eukprot:XP_005840346.1 hypothetical protein GUITHDRAFT_101070 [Guillardia theta CCMP2712]